MVRSSVQTNDQSGTIKCARSRCKTCPFIHNVEKISGHKRSIKITDHFTCTCANVIYCITCTYCNKLYVDETGRLLGDRFREHLRDVERNDKDISESVARHLNLRSLRLSLTSRQFGKLFLRACFLRGKLYETKLVPNHTRVSISPFDYEIYFSEK